MTDGPWGSVPISFDFLSDTAANDDTYGHHLFLTSTGASLMTPLTRRRMPTIEQISERLTNPPEAAELRRELEEGFLIFYFWRHLSPSPISEEQRNIIIEELERDGGFSTDRISVALHRHQDGGLTGSIEQWLLLQQERRVASEPERALAPHHYAADQRTSSRVGGTATPPESENSWGDSGTEDDPEADKEGQSLLNLLYRIAEEQARKDGYVHRRVTCNSCNVAPIRGIRYRCANCMDYDLCEQCEAMQIHPKTHIFYKIRVPAPYLGTSRQPEPVWYPGKPNFVTQNLSKDAITRIAKDTGYQAPEIEALWEQFRCLAAAEFPEDPSHYYQAIDRRTFDKCFVPNISIRPSPPNLIYDRIFSFYDQNNDGLIGFEEFIKGLASLTRKNLDERLKRIFKGYDIDDDGYVDRKDFLRMFRAYYAISKELTRDIVAGMDDEVSDNSARDIVLGSQPLSSAFSGTIPRGERARTSVGKVQDRFGDLVINDNGGVVENWDPDLAAPNETLADIEETAVFGDVRARSTNGYLDCSAIYSDPWPPSQVSEVDVEKLHTANGITGVQGISTAPEQVIKLTDQRRVRRFAHERVARDFQKRQFVRRQAIRNRRRRQAFHLDSEIDTVPFDTDYPRYSGMGLASKADILRLENLRRVTGSDQETKMCAALADDIRDLEWPVESPTELVDTIVELFKLGWTAKAIEEDFSGYNSGLADCSKLVAKMSERIEEAAKSLSPEPEKGEPSEPMPLLRRSRSSSKVRFQDNLEPDEEHELRSVTSMSSRSIPVNERWGGFEVPEPERDVGREVLYQVTQEAFNELLDPVFRQREDLALAVHRTTLERKRHRSQIAAAVTSVWALKYELDMYQRRWRRKASEFPVGSPVGIDFDEANWYLRFLVQGEAHKMDRFTSEKCPRCAEKGSEIFVPLGMYCYERCGYLSLGRSDEIMPKELCSRCADNCKESYIGGGPGWITCGNCGQNSTPVRKEEVRLRRILLGSSISSDVSESQHVAINDDNTSDVDPTQQDMASPRVEALQDLSSSVAAFNAAAPPSIEQDINQRPLDSLLEAAGYAAVSSIDTNGGTSTPPDPTLPQNRPNCAPPSDAILPDPTPPQYRPNSHPEEPIEKQSTDPLASRFSDDGSSSSAGEDELLSNNNPRPMTNMQRYGQAGPNPGSARLKWYAALDLIEHEDKERGGPGRLSFKEFEEVMKGEKGASLGFLGSWIEMANF